MSALIDLFSYRSTTNAINQLKAFEPFILKTFFGAGRTQQHAAETIDIEITAASDRIAQFANAEAEAKLIGKLKKTVKTITLPRTFEKKIFTAKEIADYKSLSEIYISSSAARVKQGNTWILNELKNLKERVIRRREQMACEAIATGKISVTQSDIEWSLDFGFETDVHKVTLAGADKWNEATDPDITLQILKWKKDILRRCGVNADILILGESATEYFISNSFVKDSLDKLKQFYGALDLTKANTPSGMHLGRFEGLEVFSYNQQYTKASGNVANMIGSNKAILAASKIDNNTFRLHYGPMYRIDDKKGKVYNVDMLVEPIQVNNNILEWRCEQKSTPAIHDPGAIMTIDVA